MLIRGNADQVQEAKVILRQLGEMEQKQGNMRIINLEKASAATLAEALQKLMKELKPNPIKIITPAKEPGKKQEPGLIDPAKGKTAAPIILEGDTWVPAGVAKRVFANLDVGNQVRAVFLVEPDEAIIRQNMRERGRGVQALTQDHLKTFSRFSWLYGQWLQQEAEKYNLPIVFARPRADIVGRILDVI